MSTIKVGDVEVSYDGNVVTWKAPLSRVDSDGAPKTYKLDNVGSLDWIANAYKVANKKDKRYRHHSAPDFPGWGGGAALDKNGKPLIQGKSDLAPGFLISPTALSDDRYPRTEQRRYVDSAKVPYVSITKSMLDLGIRQGDFGIVTDGTKTIGVIVADSGPGLKEGSIALAEAFGINSSPKHGGDEKKMLSWIIFKGTSQGWPVALDVIQSTAISLATQYADNQG